MQSDPTSNIITVEILNRWDATVQFSAQVDVILSAHARLGAAVQMAIAEKADLRDAYLSGADLSGAELRNADLIGADLSGAILIGADLSGAILIGADLSGAILSGADLHNANLIGADLRGAYLNGTDLRGAYLNGTDLSGADLSGTDLSGADLRGTDLSGADLRGVPVVPAIDAAIVAAIDEGGILDMSDWHKCGTTHCRAGWAITLAGDAGAQLEAKVGSANAGVLIYAASRPDMPVPDFYCDDEAAMADLRACAAQQGAVT